MESCSQSPDVLLVQFSLPVQNFRHGVAAGRAVPSKSAVHQEALNAVTDNAFPAAESINRLAPFPPATSSCSAGQVHKEFRYMLQSLFRSGSLSAGPSLKARMILDSR